MNCPICAGNKVKFIYKLCDNMKIMGPSFLDSSSSLVKCQNCGLIFMDTDSGQNEFLDYYRNWAVAPKYYEMFGENGTNEYYEHLLELFAPYIFKNSKIIDIAGSWGELAGYLYTKGFLDVTVLDPNEKCIDNAKKLGVKVSLNDSIKMNGLNGKSFDFVILNHSLEHILDIKDTAANINKVLKDDGHLFIEIPNLLGYEDENASPFNFLTFEHVVHMTANDLRNFAAQFGFEIIGGGRYYKKVSGYPSIYAVLRKGKRRPVHYSNEGEVSLLRYIKKSETSLKDFIAPLRQSQEPLILWGIGASTAILLESFNGCNVEALIDKNPFRQGLKFNINEKDYIIKPPEAVGNGTIVILSIPYRGAIEKQIREMGLTNKIVTLK